MSDRVPRIDETSSYHGRITTVVIFAAVIVLAIASLYLEPDYMAHVPVSIGVCALDSSRVSGTLESLADYVREKGGGDISWRYFDSGRPERCDFYLMTSMQVLPFIEESGMSLSLLVKGPDDLPYTRGVLVTRPGTTDAELAGGRFIFNFPLSASGFLSPLKILVDLGSVTGPVLEGVEFSGCRMCLEEIVFGVLYGRYDAGGLSLERFNYLESIGMFEKGSLVVMRTGLPVTEMVIASDRSVEQWKRIGFTNRLPVIVENAPRPLKRDLERAGIGGFVTSGENALEFFGNFSDSTTAGLIHHLP